MTQRSFVLKPGRIRCEVIGCRRTGDASKYEPGVRIICGKCWRLGHPEDRRLYSYAERQQKMGSVDSGRWEEVRGRSWERVLRTANEARAGIG